MDSRDSNSNNTSVLFQQDLYSSNSKENAGGKNEYLSLGEEDKDKINKIMSHVTGGKEVEEMLKKRL